MRLFMNWFLIFIMAFSLSALASNYQAQAAQEQVVQSATTQPEAHATPVDPVTDPGGWLSQLRTDWNNGAYVAVVLLILFGALMIARKYVPWLREGRRAVIVASVGTFITTIIMGLTGNKFPGLPLIIAAASSSIALYLDSGKPKNVVNVQPVEN